VYDKEVSLEIRALGHRGPPDAGVSVPASRVLNEIHRFFVDATSWQIDRGHDRTCRSLSVRDAPPGQPHHSGPLIPRHPRTFREQDVELQVLPPAQLDGSLLILCLDDVVAIDAQQCRE